RTGLVYIPAQEAGFPYVPEAHWQEAAHGFNTGIDFAAAAMPADPKVRAGVMAATKGALIAWDPIAQQERWRVAFKGPWNGGVLAHTPQPARPSRLPEAHDSTHASAAAAMATPPTAARCCRTCAAAR